MADLASQPTVIQAIYNWYREGNLIVNRKYQRKLVWTLEEKQRLIDSILKKYPIPAILVAEKSDSAGSYEIIDGLQRLHSIVSFIENSFPTTGGLYFDLSNFTTAKTYSDMGLFSEIDDVEKLGSKETSILLDYTLAVSVMRNANDDEINDVFDRINTYGHRLSDQERRQAGVENDFSRLVREIACEIRGDVSFDSLPLFQMPSISIDLPRSNHGYEVQADRVFWVHQGILRSTELRDSMDEQCIADIAACIISGSLVDRSKEALDSLYDDQKAESEVLLTSLEIYGYDKFKDEFKFCIQEIEKICEDGEPQKLRDIIFAKKTTNPFPSVFAALFIAMHELFLEGRSISNYGEIKERIKGISDRLETSRKATSPDVRRKNVDTIKGIIREPFIGDNDFSKKIYNNHLTVDIDASIRRSEIELPSYELKQGCVRLDGSFSIDDNVFDKVLKTICAIANNGPDSYGKVIIGVSDSSQDIDRITQLYGTEVRRVGKRAVVGVAREAKALGISMEEYFSIWRSNIANSDLSDYLKKSVLSNIDFNEYFGMGVIVITIPNQDEPSFYKDAIHYRDGDRTLIAESHLEISNVVKRF